MTFEDIKEVIGLHEKLSKNKKINKEILSFLEKQVKRETNISLEDIKILLETYEKIKADHLKVILSDIIEGKPVNQPTYIPQPFPTEKPFDPKPYWPVPPISDIPPCYSYTITTVAIPCKDNKNE